jgi:hypothetical protein
MEMIFEYLVSVGIVGFGVWILATADAGSDLYFLWISLGLVPIAIGLTSVYRVIKHTPA